MDFAITLTGQHLFCRHCGTRNHLDENEEHAGLRPCAHCGREMVDVLSLLIDLEVSWAAHFACRRCGRANPAPYCYLCGFQRIVPATADEVQKPPPDLGTGRVLEYAILTDAVGFSGHTGIYLIAPGEGDVRGRSTEIGRVPCLTISEDAEPARVRMFYCDREWTILTSASFDSVDEAKSRAERAYPGVSSRWVDAQVSKEEAARFRTEATTGTRCSFCDKRPDQVEQMIEAAGARICNQCVEAFHGDLRKG